MVETITNSIYGPVNSWRLGKSLGVDVLCVDSICSFECVYCQLGKINRVTSQRKVFVSTEKVLQDLRYSDWQSADVITFSGSGEPTLAKNLGEIIVKVKELTQKPIVILTNSTLLFDEKVRKEISSADKIFCKLDAWSNDTLQRFDRPEKNVSLEKIIVGIQLLRKEFSGFLAIQTMILRELKNHEIEQLAAIYLLIKPDEVQLNLPARPIPNKYLVETRGNEVIYNQAFRQINTISKSKLENISLKLTKLTNLPIITR